MTSHSHEQTPLLSTILVIAPQPRYPHRTLRRFCSIALTSTLIVSLLLLFLPLPLPQPSSTLPHAAWPASEGLSYLDLEKLLLSVPAEEKAREWSHYYASGPHLAGKNYSQAVWTRELWAGFGLKEVEIVEYDVWLNYPVGHRLALLGEDGGGGRRGEDEGEEESHRREELRVLYECSLEEDVLEEDGTSGLEDRIPTFNGYSANGNVTAQFVYVNYGTYWDFEDLLKANVSLHSKIAIARYGHVFRGLKVKKAMELGMTGVVLYSDPRDDGNVTVANGYKAYPDGPARNPSSVQRGSVEFLSTSTGDPTTPGYPSKPGVPRQDPGHAIPSIPSIPISYNDALPILKSLNGHGLRSVDFNEWWQKGGVELNGVDYYIGPSPPNTVLNLVNEQEYVTTPLWNVIGIINGTITDEVVVLGNHRDAWIAGGAGDPNSGSAALNEVIRSFGIAVSRGWRPLRTIVFASWDGEEYALIGSTEWVEEYLPWLSKSAVAYLNLDVGVSGPKFHAASTPLLNGAIQAATSRVASPNQTVPGQTVDDVFDDRIRVLGSGSDFTPFQEFAGIPSVDFGFAPSPDSPIYHYHSNYDSLAWMEAYGDVGWHYHVAVAKVWSLMAAHLVQTPVIAFNATEYAVSLSSYLERIKRKASESSHSDVRALAHFTNISQAITSFIEAATEFDQYAASIADSLYENIPWWKWWRKAHLYNDVRRINNVYKYLERWFLYKEGLDGRSLYKHVVFAPGLRTGYSGVTFPGLAETVENEDVAGIEVKSANHVDSTVLLDVLTLDSDGPESSY